MSVSSLSYSDPEMPERAPDLLEILARLGVAREFAAQAASSLGEKILDLLQHDPYALCDLVGASFPEVESLAVQQGFPRENPRRLRAGILYLLTQQEAEGNCFAIKNAFLRRAARLLSTHPAVLAGALQDLSSQGRVVIRGEHLWTKKLSEIEEEVARRILLLCAEPCAASPLDEPEETEEP